MHDNATPDTVKAKKKRSSHKKKQSSDKKAYENNAMLEPGRPTCSTIGGFDPLLHVGSSSNISPAPESLNPTADTQRESMNESAEFAAQSIKEKRKAAFIINAILSYKDVNDIPAVIGAMLKGLPDEDKSRIAVVLGVNAHASEKKALDEKVEKAKRSIEKRQLPVKLVSSTFPRKNDFPYGTMRNEVLHSAQTKKLTKRFRRLGFHPYISVQDFDTGSRSVGSDEGEHIFHAVDRILAGEGEDKLGNKQYDSRLWLRVNEKTGQTDEQTDEIWRGLKYETGASTAGEKPSQPRQELIKLLKSPIRPLMIAGGYRPSARDELEKKVEARQAQAKKDDVTNTKNKKTLEKFLKHIKEDMVDRDIYAAIHPLLPYAPEPNLFIDAIAAYKKSPLSKSELRFGDKRSEFDKLAKQLHKYAAEELESFYAEKSDTDVAGASVDAQNNRHPLRGQSFFNDFSGMAIETDLSRLASEFLETGKDPQAHNFTLIVDRTFNSKPNKAGVSLAKVRDHFLKKLNKKRAYFCSEAPEQEQSGAAKRKRAVSRQNPELEGSKSKKTKTDKPKLKPDKNAYRLIRNNQALLGGEKKNKLSEAISLRFGKKGKFKKLYSGVPADEKFKTFSTHQIAVQKELKKTINENKDKYKSLKKTKKYQIKAKKELEKFLNNPREHPHASKKDIEKMKEIRWWGTYKQFLAYKTWKASRKEKNDYVKLREESGTDVKSMLELKKKLNKFRYE